MNTKIYETLEWAKITQALAKETVTALGKEQALHLEPTNQREIIEASFRAIDEAWRLNAEQKALPIARLDDVSGALKRLDIAGVLNGKELAMITRLLTISDELWRFFSGIAGEEIEVPLLTHEAEQIQRLNSLRRELTRAIADDGSVFDEASHELAHIRRSIKSQSAKIRAQLDRMIRTQGQLLTDQLVTIRNDRYVLPVKVEYRHQFGGVVHDQSASGQTLYIEPAAVQELNNDVSNLRAAEQNEIARIYRELSEHLIPYTKELAANHQIIGWFDFVQAKYRLAYQMNATQPKIAKDGRTLHFNQAVHPFLDRKTAVANDIYYEAGYDMLIITGPNTGGKTITLKTLGLLQLMGQAGLYLPVASGSVLAIFDEIYADIGDEQSIEANLSTFSGHLTNIIHILNQVTSRDLVIIDELGAGTDPKEGAALGIAILNRLANEEAIVATTTHYPELKAYAFEHPKSMNASVEFDDETLSPTYRLLIGEPGRSNALEISKRLGLDPLIVEEARGYLDQNSQDLNAMISELDEERQHYEQELREVRQEAKQSEKLLRDLAKVYADLQQNKERYLEKARQEANALVERKRKQADALLSEIRNWQLNHPQGEAIKEHDLIEKRHAFNELSEEEQNLKKNKVLNRAKRQANRDHQLAVGDEVKVIPYDQVGTLVEQRADKQWVVQMGVLKMELNEKDLTYQPPKQKARQRHVTVHAHQAKNVASDLDLRGMRYEEAMQALDTYIDQALLAGYPQVTIIHGFGTGVIRNGVWDYLKKNSRVDDFHYAPHNMGGNGATIVTFRH
ncbi:MAG: endonuclease MutS2 [Aerococcus sp.]|nr:endonuclease MutS2 [Aerococcus sp.]